MNVEKPGMAFLLILNSVNVFQAHPWMEDLEISRAVLSDTNKQLKQFHHVSKDNEAH